MLFHSLLYVSMCILYWIGFWSMILSFASTATLWRPIAAFLMMDVLHYIAELMTTVFHGVSAHGPLLTMWNMSYICKQCGFAMTKNWLPFSFVFHHQIESEEKPLAQPWNLTFVVQLSVADFWLNCLCYWSICCTILASVANEEASKLWSESLNPYTNM